MTLKLPWSAQVVANETNIYWGDFEVTDYLQDHDKWHALENAGTPLDVVIILDIQQLNDELHVSLGPMNVKGLLNLNDLKRIHAALVRQGKMF